VFWGREVVPYVASVFIDWWKPNKKHSRTGRHGNDVHGHLVWVSARHKVQWVIALNKTLALFAI